MYVKDENCETNGAALEGNGESLPHRDIASHRIQAEDNTRADSQSAQGKRENARRAYETARDCRTRRKAVSRPKRRTLALSLREEVRPFFKRVSTHLEHTDKLENVGVLKV